VSVVRILLKNKDSSGRRVGSERKTIHLSRYGSSTPVARVPTRTSGLPLRMLLPVSGELLILRLPSTTFLGPFAPGSDSVLLSSAVAQKWHFSECYHLFHSDRRFGRRMPFLSYSISRYPVRFSISTCNTARSRIPSKPSSTSRVPANQTQTSESSVRLPDISSRNIVM
jgi:hypothetical protein